MERTHLSYNTHRDYNPNWGRYIESDPIGLAGGLNTYGYVEGNSLSNLDYLGLNPFTDFNNFVTDPKTVDFVGAVRDQLYSAATFSLGNGATLRDYLNISPLNITSSNYALGDGIGFAIGMIAPVPGKKFEVAYSVYYEMKLAPQFWKAGREVHFQEANRVLLNDVANDCELKSMLEKAGIDFNLFKMGVRGKAPRTSPKNFTWHHEIDNGTMRLVERDQHTKGSNFWNSMHIGPNSGGGFAKWGGK